MIQAVIFDCFGVIRPDKLLLAYQKFGGDPKADQRFIEDTIAAANHGYIPDSHHVLADRLGVALPTWLAEVNSGADNDQRLLDYIANMRHDYKIGLLSNASKGRLSEVVGIDQLTRCFDVVVESGAVGYTKPEPEAYRLVADRLGVEYPACVMVDDRPDYCTGARAVGMQAIEYHSFAAFERELTALLEAANRRPGGEVLQK